MNLAPLPRVVPVQRHHLEIIFDVSQKVVQTFPHVSVFQDTCRVIRFVRVDVFGCHACS